MLRYRDISVATRLEVVLSSVTTGNVPELKNNRLTGSTR